MLWILLIVTIGAASATTVDHKVFCSPKEMTVTINLMDAKSQVYVDKLKGYPDCQPVIEGTKATFHLSLDDIFSCGTTRVTDSKGGKLFYNRIVVETSKNKKDKLRVKCELLSPRFTLSTSTTPPSMNNENNDLTTMTTSQMASDSNGNERAMPTFRRRRDVLPEGFVEADELNITETIIGKGAVPELYVGVRQNGLSVDTQMNVQPGTPLEMEVFLDDTSADTYGILVNYMNVTDSSSRNPGQREIIIYKGCSIDPFLFNNFETERGNRLTAKFRAFKFPESSFVMFIGTVKICIRSCQGVPCSNGQVGFGRRRRDLQTLSDADERDPNQVFEVTMTTILKVDKSQLNDNMNKGALGNIIHDNEEGNQQLPSDSEDNPGRLDQDEQIASNEVVVNSADNVNNAGRHALFVSLTALAAILKVFL